MSHRHYPRESLIPDYLRAGAGFLLTGGPLLLANPSSIMIYVLGTLALLFLLYALRTALRQMTRIELTDSHLTAAGPFGTTIRWRELERVQLRYFSTRRDRSEGWMQLKLKSHERALRLDSGLTGFAEIAERAAHEALGRGLPLSDTTRANLSVLGVSNFPSPGGEVTARP